MDGLVEYLNSLDNISYNLSSIISELVMQIQDIEYVAFMETVNRYEFDALRILMDNLRQAEASSIEFNLRQFRDVLEAAFNNINIFNFRLYGGRIEVRILAEEFGGTIEEYYNGVELARDALRQGQEMGDITSASIFWSMMYNAGRSRFVDLSEDSKESKKANKKRRKNYQKLRQKYFRTIETRLSFMTKAPYWNIIDQGTILSGTEYTRGGFSTPVTQPTGFIYKTQLAVDQMMNSAFEKVYQNLYYELESDLENLVYVISEVSPAALSGVDRSRAVYFQTLRREYDVYVTPKLRLVGATLR